MTSVSPFSVLDRMKPGNAPPRIAEAARSAVDQATSAARSKAGAIAGEIARPSERADLAGRIGSAAGHLRGAFSNTINTLDRNANGHLDPGDAKALLDTALGLEPDEHPHPGADDTASPHSRPALDARPAGYDGSVAEIVVQAGLTGLGLAAQTPAQRLALSLAQTTYGTMRALS